MTIKFDMSVEETIGFSLLQLLEINQSLTQPSNKKNLFLVVQSGLRCVGLAAPQFRKEEKPFPPKSCLNYIRMSI